MIDRLKQWKLIQQRVEAGYTQAQVAKILGINASSYVNKENGITEFKASEMFILSKLFKKSIEDIFLFSDCNGSAI